MERTTSEHRAAVEAWRGTAPEQDHKIFGRKQKTDKPRHKDLSELSALLALHSRPVGVAEGVDAAAGDIPTISTNWRLTPANDNVAPDEGFAIERAVEYEPSLDFIEREIDGLPVRYRAEPAVLPDAEGSNAAVMAKREIHAIPVGGPVEYGIHIDDAGIGHQVITRIGRLRFSDGTQTERGQKLVFDKVVDCDLRMPVGSMIGAREKSTRDKGSETDASGSNAHYKWMVKGRVAHPPKLHPRKGERVDLSKEEAERDLTKARLNTPAMPKVKVYRDGFPYLPTSLRQLFIGGRKGKNGESGSQAWQDIAVEKENREEFNRGLDAMHDSHVRVLTEAMTAKSLGAIGEARGFKGRHAIDAGRRLLVAANDNFEEAMALAKFAAET